jgi:hypothetical protein
LCSLLVEGKKKFPTKRRENIQWIRVAGIEQQPLMKVRLVQARAGKFRQKPPPHPTFATVRAVNSTISHSNNPTSGMNQPSIEPRLGHSKNLKNVCKIRSQAFEREREEKKTLRYERRKISPR